MTTQDQQILAKEICIQKEKRRRELVEGIKVFEFAAMRKLKYHEVCQPHSTHVNKYINQLCLTRVTLNSLTTDKPVALGFQIELEFGNVGFCEGRKTGEPGEKPSEQGREPGPHWWEASAFTTVPSLLLR